jgi:hypothetical protein
LPITLAALLGYTNAITTEALCAAGDDREGCRDMQCPEGFHIQKSPEEHTYYCKANAPDCVEPYFSVKLGEDVWCELRIECDSDDYYVRHFPATSRGATT